VTNFAFKFRFGVELKVRPHSTVLVSLSYMVYNKPTMEACERETALYDEKGIGDKKGILGIM
jgi:hypothetical protein